MKDFSSYQTYEQLASTVLNGGIVIPTVYLLQNFNSVDVSLSYNSIFFSGKTNIFLCFAFQATKLLERVQYSFNLFMVELESAKPSFPALLDLFITSKAGEALVRLAGPFRDVPFTLFLKQVSDTARTCIMTIVSFTKRAIEQQVELP